MGNKPPAALEEEDREKAIRGFSKVHCAIEQGNDKKN